MTAVQSIEIKGPAALETTGAKSLSHASSVETSRKNYSGLSPLRVSNKKPRHSAWDGGRRGSSQIVGELLSFAADKINRFDIKLVVRPYGQVRRQTMSLSLAFEPSLMIFHRSPVQTFLRAFGSACRNTTRFSG